MDFEVKAAPEKKKRVAILEEKIGRAEGIFFTDYSGLNVAQMNQLRSEFYKAGEVEYLVAKNTLTRFALQAQGIESVEDGLLRGPMALAFSYDDPVRPIKLIVDFAKSNKLKKPSFIGGLIDGDFYDSDQVEQLKDLPPLEHLHAMVIGGMVSPLSGFVGVLNEIVREFVGVIDAIIEQKKAAGES
ncbi:50S ribosomal protein L10 [bacterium]|nr:50S ribosomal protein L10 [bacterium]